MRHYRSQCSVWLTDSYCWTDLTYVTLVSEDTYWQGSENCEGKKIAMEVKLSEKWKEAMAHDCGDVFYILHKKGEVILVVNIYNQKKMGKRELRANTSKFDMAFCSGGGHKF